MLSENLTENDWETSGSSGLGLGSTGSPKPVVRTPPPAPPRQMPRPTGTKTVVKTSPIAAVPKPTFTYFGHLGPKGDRYGAFEGKEGVFLARVGDVVDKKFKLLEFKYDSVVFGYVDEKYENRRTELKKDGV